MDKGKFKRIANKFFEEKLEKPHGKLSQKSFCSKFDCEKLEKIAENKIYFQKLFSENLLETFPKQNRWEIRKIFPLKKKNFYIFLPCAQVSSTSPGHLIKSRAHLKVSTGLLPLSSFFARSPSFFFRTETDSPPAQINPH